MSFAEGLKQIIGYLLIALFLVSYRQLYFSVNKGFTYWLAIQLGITFCLSMFYSPYNIFLGFFPGNFIGWYKTKKKLWLGMIGLAVAILVPLIFNNQFPEYSPGNQIFTYIFIVVILLSPLATRSMYRRMELEKQLDQANEKIEKLIKREERMRIARDLHDTLGHTLSLITLKSQLVEKLIEKNPERARIEAKEIEATSRTALKQVRELVSDMRSITLAEELVQAEAILNSAGISFSYDGDILLKDFSELAQNILSMCLREAVTNVVKHSQATQCSVDVQQREGEVCLTVRDNGMGGVDLSQLGNGLAGIKERLSLIDGRLELASGQGTTLRLIAPIIIKQGKEECV